MTEKSYREIHTNTVKEFFAQLNPVTVNHNQPSNLIYRGQENAEWPLTPSIFRHYGEKLSSYPKITLMLLELEMLINFSIHLGRINLSDQRIKLMVDYLLKISEEFNEKGDSDELQLWPKIEALELMALCQHAGVPTRLLDWTYSPYVAAHFAAYSSILNNNSSERMAVWRYDKEYTVNARTGRTNAVPTSNVYRLEPPFWGSNPNAIAQSGCFLFIKEIIPEELYNLDSYSNINTEYEESPLVKITVPSSEANEIIHLCDLLGVSRSKLFRTYEGCAEHLKQEMPNILSESVFI